MEKTIQITKARQQLLDLTKKVRRHMQTYILTNKGEEEAVLLSVPEYRSLMAAAELARHPEVLATTREGMEQLAAGQGVPVDKAFQETPKKALAAATAR
jgi:prevent-host-death family protein